MPIQCNQSFQVDIKRFKLHLISKYFSLVCNQGQFDKDLLDLEMKSYWPKQIWADFKMIIMFLDKHLAFRMLFFASILLLFRSLWGKK